MILLGYALLSLCTLVFIGFFTIGAYKIGGKPALIASIGTFLFWAAFMLGTVLLVNGSR